MSKVFNKAQLLEKAKPIFEKYAVKKLYGVSDGQIFLLPVRAEAHAAGKNVYTLEKEPSQQEGQQDGSGSASGELVKTVALIQQEVAAIEDVELLRQMLLDEVGGLNRKTATKAIEKRIEQLVGVDSPELRGEKPSETKTDNEQ